MRSQDTTGRYTWKFFDAPKRLSLSDFLREARLQHANMVGALAATRRTNELLHKWDTIWPDQCDYIASSLQHIRLPIHDFAVLLGQTSRIPLPVIAPNYQVVAELNYFEVQIQRFLTFLAPFRSISHTQSHLLFKQHLEVLQRIEETIYDGEEIIYQIDVWLDSLEP